MKQETIFSILVLLILISCSNRKIKNDGDTEHVKPYPHFMNMSEGLKNTTQLKLSEIADSIKYVVLSKDKQILLGSVRSVQLTDSNIYLKSDNLVMRFSLSGRFLNSIGSLGRGPEEYLPGSGYTINPKIENVIIHRSMMNSYLIFKPDGSYIGERDFSTPRTMYAFSSISDSVFLCTFFYVGAIMKDYIENSINWLAGLFDHGGSPLKVLDHPLKNIDISKTEINKISSRTPAFTFFDHRAVLSPIGDTIYEADKDSISPGFIFDWGSLPHKQSIEELYFSQTTPGNKVVISIPVFETATKLFFRGSRNMNDNFIFEYDKVTGSCRSMITGSGNFEFINDLDGGSGYFPYWTNRKGDIWIVSEDANIFKEKHSEEFLSKSVAFYPERKRKLRAFIYDLKMDDNPVLKIVYLKN